MKNLNKLFVAAMMFVGVASQAQDSNNPWAFSFGVNAVDTRVSAHENFGTQFQEYFNVKENWNILPSVSYINVSKYVGDNFSIGLTGSVNKIDKWSVNPAGADNSYIVNPGDLTYYGADAVVKYSFMNMIGSKVIDPSAHIGGGYTFFGDASAGTVNGGLGLTFWMSESVGLQLQSTYKHSFDDTRVANVDVPSHLQHFVGLTFKFGGKDTDGDGIYDKNDSCPEVAGIAAFNGCPDTDGDGIQDSADSCPEVAGVAELNGCPDADGDGITDADDACPEVAGTKMMNGCPDADGDGVADKDDKCPSVKGDKANAGCPWADTDGDGVADKDDKCPSVAGTAKNNGCPEVSQGAVDKLNSYAKTILFNSGKSSFQSKTFPVLQAITAILKEYPSAKFSIEGHTDADGAEASNLKLSEDRAGAVKDYFIENGVDASRLTSKGFGESMPMDSNKTRAGKANNRRVEVKLMN